MSNDTPTKADERSGLLEQIHKLEDELAQLRRELVDRQQDTSTPTELLTFMVHGHPYAFFLSDVREVLRMVKWQPLSKAPPDVQGVINVRGNMVALLNPGAIFSDHPVEPKLSSQLIVVGFAGESIAVLVDSVTGVETHAIQNLAERREKTLPEHLLGFVKTGDRQIGLIDASRLIHVEQQRALKAALRERDAWGQY